MTVLLGEVKGLAVLVGRGVYHVLMSMGVLIQEGMAADPVLKLEVGEVPVLTLEA